MASVSGSDSSSASASSRNDDVRKNREEYQQNESEMVKRHQKEVKRLNEQHAMEVEGLKKEHERQVGEMQKNSSKSLTEKDQKYQSEIENLRTMHRKQLQSTADDQQKREETYKNSAESEKADQAVQNETRVRQLNENYKHDNDERESRVTESLGHNQEEMQRGLNDQRSNLIKAHQNETEESRKSANERIGQLQKDYSSYRRETQEQMRKGDLKHFEDSQRQGDNLVRAVAKERNDRAEAEAKWHDDSGEGLQGVREQYRKDLDKNQQGLENARADMENNYHGHVAHEMRTLTNENESLKDGNDRYQRRADEIKSREISSFKDGYNKNIENYRVQRDEAVRTSNERRAKDINDLNDKNTRTLTETNRYYNTKREDQDRRLKSEYQNINSDFKARTDQLEAQTDNRVKSVISSTEDEKQRLVRLTQDNHDIQQQQHADSIKAMRVNTDTEKADAIERVKEQARQLEISHVDKMASSTQKYQKEILNLQDQMLREHRSFDDSMKRTVDEMERAHKVDMDQQMAKYEERIRVLQNQQSEDLRRVNRANDDRMTQLAATKKA